MAEKQQFVQIVDKVSGKIERIINLSDIQAMTAEEKLALSKSKSLFIVTHHLEPIVKVELKKSVVSHAIYYSNEETPSESKEESTPPEPAPKATRGKKSKS